LKENDMRSTPTSIDVAVRYQSGAYVTNTVQGQRVSCTHSAEEAARRLGTKLFGDGLRQVQRIAGQGHAFVDYYRLHGVMGEKSLVL